MFSLLCVAFLSWSLVSQVLAIRVALNSIVSPSQPRKTTTERLLLSVWSLWVET